MAASAAGFSPAAPAEIVASGLIAEYRFDDGAGQVLTDYGGNALHGQLGATTGAEATDPTWVTEGLSFDGGDYVKLTPGSVAATTTWTVCFVAKAAAQSATALYAEGRVATASPFLIIGSGVTDISALRIYLRTDAATNIILWEAIPAAWDDTWHFYAARRDGVTFVATMDGFETSNPGTTGVMTLPDAVTIGALIRNSIAQQWTGSAAWLAVYNRSLTPAEVQQNRAYALALLA